MVLNAMRHVDTVVTSISVPILMGHVWLDVMLTIKGTCVKLISFFLYLDLFVIYHFNTHDLRSLVWNKKGMWRTWLATFNGEVTYPDTTQLIPLNGLDGLKHPDSWQGLLDRHLIIPLVQRIRQFIAHLTYIACVSDRTRDS